MHVSAPARGAVAVRGGPVVVSRGAPVVAPRGAVGVRVVSPSGVVVVRGPFVPFHNRFRNPFFRGCFNCGFFPGFGFGFGTGFGFGAPFYPYYPAPYYPNDYSSPPPYYPSDYYGTAAPQTTSQDNANDVYIAAMLQKLTDDMEAMKNDQKGRAASGLTVAPSKGGAEGPAVTFIFHDGTRISTHNYAIAGQTIWIFGENQARKFRLADVDRAATEQANAAQGVELRLPEPAPAR